MISPKNFSGRGREEASDLDPLPFPLFPQGGKEIKGLRVRYAKIVRRQDPNVGSSGEGLPKGRQEGGSGTLLDEGHRQIGPATPCQFDEKGRTEGHIGPIGQAPERGRNGQDPVRLEPSPDAELLLARLFDLGRRQGEDGSHPIKDLQKIGHFKEHPVGDSPLRDMEYLFGKLRSLFHDLGRQKGGPLPGAKRSGRTLRHTLRDPVPNQLLPDQGIGSDKPFLPLSHDIFLGTTFPLG